VTLIGGFVQDVTGCAKQVVVAGIGVNIVSDLLERVPTALGEPSWASELRANSEVGVAEWMTVDEVEAAVRRAHTGQVDKAGRPYIEHLQAVAERVRERGGTGAQIAAAWLHDAIEDGALSREWLRDAGLSEETKDIVLAVTKYAGESPGTYAARILATPGALVVKEADLAHNTSPDRLAALDGPTRQRLIAKCAAMRSLLGLADGPRRRGL
jgi:hypothetical protein